MANIIQLDELLIVRHSHLNSRYDERIFDTENLVGYTNGRKPVNCLEGDIVQVEETKEPVLTHHNFGKLRLDKFRRLREEGLAFNLEESLERVRNIRDKTGQKLVLCLELKTITQRETIQKALNGLREYGITDFYFDSFFGNKLDQTHEVGSERDLTFPLSYHLAGNVKGFKFGVCSPKYGYDFITVPRAMSFGNPREPYVHGAVGSLNALRKLSEDPLALGAYLRLKEGAGLKSVVNMFWNSLTNTAKFRKIS